MAKKSFTVLRNVVYGFAFLVLSQIGLGIAYASTITVDFESETGWVDGTAHENGATYINGNIRLTTNGTGWFEDTNTVNDTNTIADSSTGTAITVETVDGSELAFQSFFTRDFGGGDIAQIEGFRDGASTGVQTTGVSSGGAPVTVTLNAAIFSNVDRMVITSGGIPFVQGFDNFVFASVDLTPPVVQSIAPQGSPTGTVELVNFDVTFDEAATNVDASDFTLTTTGAATGSIFGVTGSGASYTVIVNAISNNSGTLRVDLKSNTDITDALGNGNGTNGNVAAFTSGTTHTVTAVSFTITPDLGSVCANAGLQTLSGGSPAGGVYSNIAGVTDKGDGTFDFDPSALGTGGLGHTVAYSFGLGNFGVESSNRIIIDALPSLSFTALADLEIGAGVQTGLGSGTPTGGVYSGSGITDDGNGMTYSFDPAVAGVGVHAIFYSYTDANGCSDTISDAVEVFPPQATITSATFDALTGNLVVTGTNFLSNAGAANDIDVSLLAIGTAGGFPRALTTSSDVERTSATQFTVAITGADRTAVDAILDANGTQSSGGSTYNLEAFDNWLPGAPAAQNIADSTNSITVSNVDNDPPTGYTVVIDPSPINAGNESAVSFTFAGAEVGATYNYTLSSSGGGTNITGSGTIATATDQITGINVSGLGDGTITLSATLTDVNGNTGSAATDTETKETVAPTGYNVVIDQSPINAGNESAVSFTFTGAEVGATYNYTLSSSGGGTNITGSGIIATATDQITGIDVSGLGDGTITLSVTLTDASGNTGSAATDTETKETAAPTGYSASIDQSPINIINQTAVSFTFAGAEVGATYNYTLSSSGGAGLVTVSGTIATATDQITGINLSGLADGTITLSVTLTDVNGNTGSAATDTETKDSTPITAATSTAAGFNTTNGTNLNPALTYSNANETLTIGAAAHVSGSTLNGGGGTDILNLNNGENLTQVSVLTGFETLNIADGFNYTMNESQHDGFTTINGAGTAQIILATANDDNSVTGAASVDGYVLNDVYAFTLGASVQNVSANAGANQSVSVAGLSPTGTLDGGAGGTDTLQMFNGANISAASVFNFETLQLASGAAVSMSELQYESFSTISAAPGSETLTLSTPDGDGAVIGNANIENYSLMGAFTFTAPPVGISVSGDAGNQTFIGGIGVDTIRPGGGVDSMTGGAGADVFSGSDAHLNGDTIADLEGGDVIILTGFALSNANVAFSADGSTLLIDTDGTSPLVGADINITLSNNPRLVFNVGNDSTDTAIAFFAPPRVESIQRQSPATSPTSSDTLIWDVTFSEAVVNVDATDFAVSNTTATINPVTNPSGNVWRVSISGGDLANLDATVALSIDANQNIQNGAGTALIDLTPTGANESFVVDNTGPTIDPGSSLPADNAVNISVDDTLLLSFSENVNLVSGGTISLFDVTNGQIRETFTASSATAGTGSNGGSMSVSANAITLTPGQDLQAHFTYAVQIASNTVVDTQGNEFAGISDNTTLNFTTLPALILTVNPATVSESAEVATFTVALVDGNSNPVVADGNVTVTTTIDGGSTATGGGTDFSLRGTTSGGTFQVDSGQSTNTFIVTSVDDGQTGESPETIIFAISGPGGNAFLGASTSATVTIVENRAPTVAVPIPDQTAGIDNLFSFTFDAGTFVDADNDNLSYSAQLLGGGMLPLWLSFDGDTRTFSGTPLRADIGDLNIEVIASDAATSVSDVFVLSVVDNTAPTVTITSNLSNPTSSASISGSIFFSEPVTGFTEADLNVSGALVELFSEINTVNGFGSFFIFSLRPTADGGGAITVDIGADAAQDAAGNGNLQASQFGIFFDGTPSLKITHQGLAVGPFTARFLFTETVTGFTSTDISVTNGVVSNFQMVSASEYSATITPITLGKEVRVMVPMNAAFDSDGVGNVAQTKKVLGVFPIGMILPLLDE